MPPELAIEALKAIQTLEIPQEALENPGTFFKHSEIGKVLATIVDEQGGVTARSAGYNQLSGTDGSEFFLATHYPTKVDDKGRMLKPGAFHAWIIPVGEQTHTKAITISTETGRPMVCKNIQGQYGRRYLGELLGPAKSLAEIQHLANIMEWSISRSGSEPQAITALEEIAV